MENKIQRDSKGRFVKGSISKNGFKKGHITWSAGLTKETDERVKKLGEKGSITKKRLYAEGKLISKFIKGHKPKKEWIENSVKARKNKPLSEDHKNKIRIANFKRKEKLGYLNSPETRRKQSESKKGEKNPFFGKHPSKATIIKKSATMKKLWQDGKFDNPERSRKLSEANKGRIISEETKKKLKLTRAKQIFPIKDTKIEKKMQGMLNDLKINFIPHKRINDIEHSYQCDIFIPQMNLIIETDGNYWHNYPYGTEIDLQRNKELKEKRYRLIRLWENEIKNMELNDLQNLFCKIED